MITVTIEGGPKPYQMTIRNAETGEPIWHVQSVVIHVQSFTEYAIAHLKYLDGSTEVAQVLRFGPTGA